MLGSLVVESDEVDILKLTTLSAETEVRDRAMEVLKKIDNINAGVFGDFPLDRLREAYQYFRDLIDEIESIVSDSIESPAVQDLRRVVAVLGMPFQHKSGCTFRVIRTPEKMNRLINWRCSCGVINPENTLPVEN